MEKARMCLAVYIGSEIELKENAWNKNEPNFYIEAVPSANNVRKQFSTTHVYYAGSHEGCGCGFFKEAREPEEFENVQENYKNLALTIKNAVEAGRKIQLFSCWEDDQAKQPEIKVSIGLSEIVNPEFEFKELNFLNVVSNA